MKLKHTRDTLEVFLYVVRNGTVSLEELATHFDRSRYWSRGTVMLFVDDYIPSEGLLRWNEERREVRAEYKDETDALKSYVAALE